MNHLRGRTQRAAAPSATKLRAGAAAMMAALSSESDDNDFAPESVESSDRAESDSERSNSSERGDDDADASGSSSGSDLDRRAPKKLPEPVKSKRSGSKHSGKRDSSGKRKHANFKTEKAPQPTFPIAFDELEELASQPILGSTAAAVAAAPTVPSSKRTKRDDGASKTSSPRTAAPVARNEGDDNASTDVDLIVFDDVPFALQLGVGAVLKFYDRQLGYTGFGMLNCDPVLTHLDTAKLQALAPVTIVDLKSAGECSESTRVWKFVLHTMRLYTCTSKVLRPHTHIVYVKEYAGGLSLREIEAGVASVEPTISDLPASTQNAQELVTFRDWCRGSTVDQMEGAAWLSPSIVELTADNEPGSKYLTIASPGVMPLVPKCGAFEASFDYDPIGDTGSVDLRQAMVYTLLVWPVVAVFCLRTLQWKWKHCSSFAVVPVATETAKMMFLKPLETMCTLLQQVGTRQPADNVPPAVVMSVTRFESETDATFATRLAGLEHAVPGVKVLQCGFDRIVEAAALATPSSTGGAMATGIQVERQLECLFDMARCVALQPGLGNTVAVMAIDNVFETLACLDSGPVQLAVSKALRRVLAKYTANTYTSPVHLVIVLGVSELVFSEAGRAFFKMPAELVESIVGLSPFLSGHIVNSADQISVKFGGGSALRELFDDEELADKLHPVFATQADQHWLNSVGNWPMLAADWVSVLQLTELETTATRASTIARLFDAVPAAEPNTASALHGPEHEIPISE